MIRTVLLSAAVTLLASGAALGASEHRQQQLPLIVFSGARTADRYAIYTVRADGSRRASLGAAFTQSEGARIAFSPDGRRVAFTTDYEVAIANTDGTGRRELEHAQVNGGGAVSWSPDGRLLAVSSEGVLSLVEVATGKRRGVVVSGQAPVFSPRGDLIAFFDQGTLAVVDVEKGHVRRLAAAPHFDELGSFPPSWSPDGRRIAYERLGDIFVYELAVGRARNLTRSARRGETEPAWSPDGRWIAFVRGPPASARDLRTGVSIIRPDGNGLRVLTDEQFVENAPVWSPDSRRLAFLGGAREARVAEPPNTAYTVGIGGGKAKRIVRQDCRRPEHVVSLVWGRSGRIAFASTTDYNDTQIFAARIDMTGVRRLATSCSEEFDPAWSPDGTRIAYTRAKNRLRPAEIYVMRSNGGQKQRVATGYAPDWSPDGKSIVFASAGKNGQVSIVPVAGGAPRQLTREGANGSPNWSTAAGSIAFDSNRDGRPEIYTMRRDGSDQRRVTRLGGSGPSWAPDGKRIAFVLGPNIWTIQADGSNATRITSYDECTSVAEPAWSPDGSTIAFNFYSNDNEEGGIAFVPAEGGEVKLLPYDPRLGAEGSEESGAPTHSSPDWHPDIAATASLHRRPARHARTSGCIT